MPSLRTTTKILLLPLCWATGVLNLACSAGDARPADATANADADDSDADFVTDSDDIPASDVIPEDARWGLTGELTVVDGQLDIALSAMVLEVRSSAETCLIDAPITSAEPMETPPEPAFAWWEITIAPEAAPPCRWPGTTTFGLGLVEPDPVLAAEAVPLDLTLDTTYGIVVDADSPLLIGLAGTAAHFDGTESRVLEAPVTDGVYELVTLYGIPLEQ